MLHKLNLIMSSEQHKESYGSVRKQRELIPLIQVILKTNKILCCEDGGSMKDMMNNNCIEAKADVIWKFGYTIKHELINALYEDNIKLDVLHYQSYSFPPSSLNHLIEKSSDSLVSLKLTQINPWGRIRPLISGANFRVKKRAKAISEVTFTKPNS